MSLKTKSNMIIKTTLSFDKGDFEIKLPFYFHIKDLKNDFLEQDKENIIEDSYSSELMNKIELYKSYLQYVDLDYFLFDGIDENIISMYNFTKKRRGWGFTDVNSLYLFLVTELMFNDTDFQVMKRHINENQYRLALTFRDMIEKEMELTKKSEVPSRSYMELRCAYELTNLVIFPENEGKCISEHSFREDIARQIYMARKCEIEKIQYDKLKNSNK